MYGFHNPNETFHDGEKKRLLIPGPVIPDYRHEPHEALTGMRGCAPTAHDIDQQIGAIVRENKDKTTLISALRELLSKTKNTLAQFAIRNKIQQISEPETEETYEWA